MRPLVFSCHVLNRLSFNKQNCDYWYKIDICFVLLRFGFYSGKLSFTFSYNCKEGHCFKRQILESWSVSPFFFLFQSYNFDEWPREKFSLQYQYKIYTAGRRGRKALWTQNVLPNNTTQQPGRDSNQDIQPKNLAR